MHPHTANPVPNTTTPTTEKMIQKYTFRSVIRS
jgi:hypothetical protein